LGEVDVEVEESEGKRRNKEDGEGEKSEVGPPEEALLLSGKDQGWLNQGRLVEGLRHARP
jgi:hypothetical protein